MLRCSLWRPPNVHANWHAAQISQQAQGQDYFHSVPCPSASTEHSRVGLFLGLSRPHAALEISPMCEQWQAYLYTQHWGRECETGKLDGSRSIFLV